MKKRDRRGRHRASAFLSSVLPLQPVQQVVRSQGHLTSHSRACGRDLFVGVAHAQRCERGRRELAGRVPQPVRLLHERIPWGQKGVCEITFVCDPDDGGRATRVPPSTAHSSLACASLMRPRRTSPSTLRALVPVLQPSGRHSLVFTDKNRKTPLAALTAQTREFSAAPFALRPSPASSRRAAFLSAPSAVERAGTCF